MGETIALKQEQRLWRVPTLEEQADTAEKHGVDTLLYCRDRWAVRHWWVHKETGEKQRARCNRWECTYCGPRKVDLWRQLVKQAEPTLFLTLTKAGKTVEEAARALTTFVQALRRGSKGRGPNRVGARPAYPIEYFAVLEEHSNFQENGFHWHLLIKGVDHIPYDEVIVPLWTSAVFGKDRQHLRKVYEKDGEEVREERYGWVERIRNQRAIGYVTKYLTKAVGTGRRGVKQVKHKQLQAVLDPVGEGGYEYQVRVDEQGDVVTEIAEEVKEVVSKAHRVRYSRQFFPEAVAEMRKRLFAGLEGASEQGDDKPVEENVEQEEKGSPWQLMEMQEEEVNIEVYEQQRAMQMLSEIEEMVETDPVHVDQLRREVLARVSEEVRELKREVYQQRKRRRLLEVLEDMNEGRCFLSRRVINIWCYQRQYARRAA
jgi:hypothetical protein